MFGFRFLVNEIHKRVIFIVHDFNVFRIVGAIRVAFRSGGIGGSDVFGSIPIRFGGIGGSDVFGSIPIRFRGIGGSDVHRSLPTY